MSIRESGYSMLTVFDQVPSPPKINIMRHDIEMRTCLLLWQILKPLYVSNYSKVMHMHFTICSGSEWKTSRSEGSRI